MRIADGVAMLELPMKVMGFDTVIHPTLVWDDADVVLIDAGLPDSVPFLTEAMAELGVPVQRISRVVLTHQDMDHIGGLTGLLQAVGHPVEVIAHAEEAPYIQGDKPLLRMGSGAPPAMLANLSEEARSEAMKMMAAARHRDPITVDTLAHDGDVLPWCGGITVAHTPGHTPGHICLYLNQSKVLVCGDELEVLEGSLTGPRPGLSADEPLAYRSISTLTRYDVDTAVCYHGGVWDDDTNGHINELARKGAPMTTTQPAPPRTPALVATAFGALQPGAERHWTSIRYADGMMTDALAKHLLGLQQYGMTDLAEVLEVFAQLPDGTEESWITGWTAMAERLQHRAETAERAGKLVTASTAYLRASTYWRTSVMYFSDAGDPRMVAHSRASAHSYQRYLELSGYPGEYVEIPYEDSFLPGHFYTSPVAEEKAPVLVITPGRDTWAEDTRWIYDGAIRRGIHALVYDGPGQGFALRTGGLTFRPDWENVLGPVIDYAVARPEVDPSRVGLFGVSFGGFLSMRAAATEKRAKVCITDPGSINWGGSISGRLRMLADLPDDQVPLQMKNMIADYAWKHGVPNTIPAVIAALAEYDNSAIAPQVSAKTLVIDGTEEMTPGEARKLYDLLTCPKDYLIFDAATTAQTHSQMGSYATATELLFDWLDERL